MNKILMWVVWLVGLVINAYLALYLAKSVGLLFWPWPVHLFLLVMEIVPLLWMSRIIKETVFVNRDLVLGYWIVMQALIFVFDVVVFLILTSSWSWLWIVVLPVMGFLAVMVRIINMRQVLKLRIITND